MKRGRGVGKQKYQGECLGKVRKVTTTSERLPAVTDSSRLELGTRGADDREEAGGGGGSRRWKRPNR